MPFLFGVCTARKPYKIVTQFYHFSERMTPCTIHQAILNNSIPNGGTWLLLVSQMFEAIRYLHDDAYVIHNDIKTNNILLKRTSTSNSDIHCQGR